MGNCNFKTENETDNVAGKYQIFELIRFWVVFNLICLVYETNLLL